jgi:hypothetical protein
LIALSEGNLGARDQALELVAELQVTQAKPDVVRIFLDDRLAINTRLRACVALAALGDPRGADLMKKAASGGRAYAIRYLPTVMGDDAAPVLCEVVRRFGNGCSHLAWDAMRRVASERGVPLVVEVLRQGHCTACIDFAVECLAIPEWKPNAALPDLIKLLESKPRTRNPLWTQQLAAEALGALGPDAEAALPALTRLAEVHARDEWAKVKSHQPVGQRNLFGDMRYSNDDFVDAICKIRSR